jgi:hypothetical protein
MEVNVQFHAPVAISPGKEPPVHIGIGDSVDLTAGPEAVKKMKYHALLGIEPRPSTYI